MRKVLGASNKGYRWSLDGKFWNIGSVSNKGATTYPVGDGRLVVSSAWKYTIDLRSKKFTNREIDDKVLVVINELFAPYLYEEYFDLSQGFGHLGEKLTYKTGFKQTPYYELSAEEVNRYDSYTSLIDWNADCNMNPMTTPTYAELLKLDLIQDFPMYDWNMIKDTQKLKDMIKKVENYLLKRKQAFLGEVNAVIDSIKGSDAEVIGNTTNKEEINDVLNFKDMFENALKDGNKAIAVKLADNLFAYDNSLIKKLLISTIYEILQHAAQQLKFLFTKINQEIFQIIDSNDFYWNEGSGRVWWNDETYFGSDNRVYWDNYTMLYTIDSNSINIDFNRGLHFAVNKYFQVITKNIKLVNENYDRKVITFACDFFKQERDRLQIDAFKMLDSLEKQPTSTIRTYTQDYLEIIPININTPILTNLRSVAANIMLRSQGMGTNQEPMIRDTLNAFYETYFYNSAKYAENVEVLISSSYDNTMRRYDAALKELYFQYEGEIYEFSEVEDHDRIIKYINEIKAKFISRCKELLHICYNQISPDNRMLRSLETFKTNKKLMKKVLDKFTDDCVAYANNVPVNLIDFTTYYNFKDIQFYPRYEAVKFIEEVCRDYNVKKGVI